MPIPKYYRHSVQETPDARREGAQGGLVAVADALTTMLSVYSTADECPSYWSKWRDVWLRRFVTTPGNDLLAGAVSTVCAKVATTNWVVEGPERTANATRKMLNTYCAQGSGWTVDVMRGVFDYLTQDSGWSWERVRQGRDGSALGLCSFDAAKITITGDPEYPANYIDRDGKRILLHRSQIMRIVDMSYPAEKYRGVGFCAVSRALTTARILMDIARYERERLSDLPPAGMLLISNMTPQQWQDVAKRYDVSQQQQGNTTWRDLLVAFGLDPALPLKAELLSFSQLPEHFDRRTATEIAIYSFALAFREDPRELWPVSSGTMGTATEAQIQHVKARAKGSGLILTDVERNLNDGLTLPPTCTFKFDYQDTDEDEQSARIANEKALFVRKLWEPPMGASQGILTTQEARNWLVKEKLFDQEDLPELEEPEEPTPEEIAAPPEPAEEAPPGEDIAAEDIAAAKSLARLDMGPRARVYRDGRVIRLEKRAQLWPGVRLRAQLATNGKVQPRGKPLSEWPQERPVPITPEDVALAMRKWDQEMPVEYRGMLAPQIVEQ